MGAGGEGNLTLGVVTAELLRDKEDETLGKGCAVSAEGWVLGGLTKLA